MEVKNCAFTGTGAAILIAIFMANKELATIIMNMIIALVAILVGSILGLAIMVKIINSSIAKPEVKHQMDPVLTHADEMPSVTSDEQNKQFVRSQSSLHNWILWPFRQVLKFVDHLKDRLVSSSLVQLVSKPSATSTVLNGPGVYEIIHNLGETPEDLLTSEYGPTSSYNSRKTVCVSPGIDEVLHTIFEYTYKDFVEVWYAHVSSDRGKLHKMLRADYWKIVKSFSHRLKQIDVLDLIMTRFTSCLTQHFEELRLTLKHNPTDEKPAFLLHPALNNDHSELEHLRLISNYILFLTLPTESSNISSLRYILREIIAGLALLPMVEKLCDPDYINHTVLTYLQHRDTSQDEQTRAYAYAATYEDFIKIINNCRSPAELRQIRYRIMTEIIHATTISSLKKDQSKAGKARSMDKGELLITRNLKRYINQCQVAKQQCEKKIRALGGADFGGSSASASADSTSIERQQLLSFDEIMSSPIARSYFLKYLRKIGKSHLLNYWNQIEIAKSTKPGSKELAKIVSYAYQTFVLPSSPEQLALVIDKPVMKGMQDCVLGNKDPSDFYHVQKQVYEVLRKDHFPSFVVSDIYTLQLAPEIDDRDRDNGGATTADQQLSASMQVAFGSDHSTDSAIQRLKMIDEKLEYKAQALASLKPSANLDPKVSEQLAREIHQLQEEKWRVQLHIERTAFWWDNLDGWDVNVHDARLASEAGGVGAVPVYSITVQLSDMSYFDGCDDVAGWTVERSLKDFNELHQRLKECSAWLNTRSLPKLSVFRFGTYNDKFIVDSKDHLHLYLNEILQDDTLRCSQFLYGFLSPGPEHGATASDGDPTNDGAGAGSSPIQNIGDFLKRIPIEVVEKMSRQLTDDAESDDDEISEEDGVKDSVASKAYLLIGEVFELKGVFRFLRQTLIVFVRVAFGRTIDRQLRETCEWLCSEAMIVYYMQTFLDSLWPDGKLAESSPCRTDEEKLHTKRQVCEKLLHSIPEAVSATVGHENARRGVLKVFHALQDRRVNKHLMLNLMDELVEVIFPEIVNTGPAEVSAR